MKNMVISQGKRDNHFLIFLSIIVAVIFSIIFFISLLPLSYSEIDNNNSSKALDSISPQSLNTSLINSGNPPNTTQFNISKQFEIKPILWNLSLPTDVEFDKNGNMFIAESGFAFGGLHTIPRILKVDNTGMISVLTDRFLEGPIVDMVYHNNSLFVANKVSVSKVDPKDGSVKDVITALPAGGDHPVTQIAFGPDNRLYVGVGSATNSGVVGVDNYLPTLGWLASFPMVHDISAKDITLDGLNFEAPNILADGLVKINATKDMNKINIQIANRPINFTSGNGTAAVSGNYTGKVSTGAFVKFGNSTSENEIIQGQNKCNGCILSSKEDGTDLKLVAWGLRLDFSSGITFDNDGNLIIADSGSEERGSRPIANDHDKLWKIDISNTSAIGKWYGWPDYFLGSNTTKLSPATDSEFKSERSNSTLDFLIKDHPTKHMKKSVFSNLGYAVKPTKAKLVPQNSSIAELLGFDNNTILIGEYGTHAPSTHSFNKSNLKIYISGNNGSKILGQKIIALDSKIGNYSDFLSLLKPDPSFRPVGLTFTPDGNALYVVSFGKSRHVTHLPNGEPVSVPFIWVDPNSGVLWRVSLKDQSIPNSSVEPKLDQLSLSSSLKIGMNSSPKPNTSFLNVATGYNIEPILWNLNTPGSIAFDDKDNMYIGEVGYAYVGIFPSPRILKVDSQTNNVSIFVDRGLDRPLSDVEFHEGKLYVSNGGRISIIEMNGTITNIIKALPGIGDHYVSQIEFGPDSRMYFGIGTATNSAIVAQDNPWAKRIPTYSDIPGKNITLAGVNHSYDDFLTAEKNDIATTGAFVPYNTSTLGNQVIKGDIKCTGCILSANPDGTDLKIVAWGLRHPYGLGFTADNKLLVTMNGVDERGTRNIANDGDKIYVIDVTNSSSLGHWYGWPDFFGEGQPVTDQRFQSDLNKEPLKFLMKDHPSLEKPFHVFDTGAALTQVAFSNNAKFGFKDKAIIGEFGTLAPQTHVTAVPEDANIGSVMGQIIGQRVIVFDSNSREIKDLVSLNTADGSFRPTGVEMSPDGRELYIASIGFNEVRTITPTGAVLKEHPLGLPWLYPNTGVIWKVTHND
jgi:glucose/arabinose dehydrogenase